jgi:hypothetical protein
VRQTSAYLLDRFDDLSEVRKFTRLELGINLLAINNDLKRAAGTRSQGERLDSVLQCQKFFRQTDGFRLVVSNRTVLNDDFDAHACPSWQWRPGATPNRRSGPGDADVGYRSPGSRAEIFPYLRVIARAASQRPQTCDRTTCFLHTTVPAKWELQVFPLDRQRAPEAFQHKWRPQGPFVNVLGCC